ncbi:hypothetical protein MN116_006699 [Schistosoma mekongi]|uniref:DNA-directed RNA polymerase RpoA/D/Rpb3-type domain-containing protein n=1 Tax=Schistosoma mekongi TaxID=38744 RepID=A0AAE1Z983_SCHME|nr:hypothetical protein MN116_006699 [Schistosoma mekongi]
MESSVRKTYYELKDHGVLHHPGVEDPWNLNIFKKKFHVEIICRGEDTDTMEFDMINLDCSFANAIRRILVSEVPSLAIERVYITQNTSIMPDEVMCHRLGLIPLAVDPKYFLFPTRKPPSSDDISGFDPKEHLVYDMHVGFSQANRDSRNKPDRDKTQDGTIPVAQYLPVYSSDLKWVPLPGQEDHFNINNPPMPVSSTILINKLALGDEIEARCVAVKGIGRDHAKFSPVAAAYYKFHPIIKLLRTIEGEQAVKLQKSFASGVIGINSRTGQAFVDNARLDNGSREHMRHPEFRDTVFVGMDSSHCIFTIETIAPGTRPPSSLVRCALAVMISKCSHYLAVTETPGFGDQVEECKPVIDVPEDNSKSHTAPNLLTQKTNRSHLNGREVGLEVTHISPDTLRATFTFFGEDHTLGLALRYCILRDQSVNFCGYCVPHPLEDMIHFDIQMKHGSAIDALRNGLQCLRDCFQHMKQTFISAMKISRSTRKSS